MNSVQARRSPCAISVAFADAIDAVLPQMQCRRCGYDGCRPYADAVAAGAPINRCPPGGDVLIATLASLTGRERIALDRSCGEANALALARIDEAICIGCTLCIDACPSTRSSAPRSACTRCCPRCAPDASCASRPAPSTASRWCPPDAHGAGRTRARRAIVMSRASAGSRGRHADAGCATADVRRPATARSPRHGARDRRGASTAHACPARRACEFRHPK